MAFHVFEFFRELLVQYGYGAIALALLLENAGLPVPGESVLLLASFLAYSQHHLRLPYIILVGTCAATLGDNIGFAIGHFGGLPLLARYREVFRIRGESIAKAESFFARYGATAIFFARFVAGMRVISGPLAGVLRMHWRKFVVYNFLGAVVWVSVISAAGYFSGKHWHHVMHVIRGVNLGILFAAAVLLAVFWYKRKKSSKKVDS
ncbi:MAG: DedA family protein [Acidobacteria bacterium]|nr:DedA family protein [Acidobacteriota bacterium]